MSFPRKRESRFAVHCIIVLLCISHCIFLPAPCLAATITVDDDDPGADFSSIQDAIDSAWDGDVIEVWPGTYNESIYFNSRRVTVTSIDPDDANIVEATILVASWTYGVTFDFGEDSNSVLAGLTVTGSGIRCYASSPTIIKNIISGCSTRGVSGSHGAAPTISDNIITLNAGGISTCHGTISGNIISANDGVSKGGGLYVCDGTIINNDIIGNEASSNYNDVYGGGLYDCDGTITNNDIIGNKASSALRLSS